MKSCNSNNYNEPMDTGLKDNWQACACARLYACAFVCECMYPRVCFMHARACLSYLCASVCACVCAGYRQLGFIGFLWISSVFCGFLIISPEFCGFLKISEISLDFS